MNEIGLTRRNPLFVVKLTLNGSKKPTKPEKTPPVLPIMEIREDVSLFLQNKSQYDKTATLNQFQLLVYTLGV